MENIEKIEPRERESVHVDAVVNMVSRIVSRDDVQRASLLIEVEKVGALKEEKNDWHGWRHFAVYFAKQYPKYTIAIPFAIALYAFVIIQFFMK